MRHTKPPEASAKRGGQELFTTASVLQAGAAVVDYITAGGAVEVNYSTAGRQQNIGKLRAEQQWLNRNQLQAWQRSVQVVVGGHLARAAKALVVSEPIAIFHPGDGKS